MTVDVAVIGGGISGLAAAHDLARRGREVLVLERQAATGGKARSLALGGFLMECGPSTINTAVPAALAAARDLGLEGSLIGLGAGVRRRYLLDERGLAGVSVHPLGFLTSSYLPVGARLSLLAEALRPPRPPQPDETVHDFAARRFGEGVARGLFDPLCAGIFMGDARRLTVADTFPRLPAMERAHGSVIRAALAARRGSEPGRRLVSWPEGLGTLPRRLHGLLGARVRTGAAVRRIGRTGEGLRIELGDGGTILARAVVLAVQPHVAAQLVEPLDPAAAAAAAAIEAPPATVVFLGYRRDQVGHPLDGLGFLATSGAGTPISGAQFASTMFPGRAPAGHVAIACYIGGARSADAAGLPAPAIEALAHEELVRLLGITGAPALARSQHWSRGLPHYTAGHGARRHCLETTPARTPGLFLTGNFLRGVSVGHCLALARDTAGEVEAYLAARGRPLPQRAAAGGA